MNAINTRGKSVGDCVTILTVYKIMYVSKIALELTLSLYCIIVMSLVLEDGLELKRNVSLWEKKTARK